MHGLEDTAGMFGHALWSTVAMTLRIVPATLEDLDAMLAIEEGVFNVPWSRQSFEAELFGNAFSVTLVGRTLSDGTDQVMAYVCAWIVFEEVRFLNLAVHRSLRRKGVASRLISDILRRGLEEGAERAMLEVRASNQPAQALYGKFGFRPYARRSGYYTNPDEDAILMTLEPLEDSWLEGTPVVERSGLGKHHIHALVQERRTAMVTDEDIAQQLRASNPEFRELEESHHRLDAELQELLKNHVLTPQEEVLRKQLQKEKLGKKDRMAALIRLHRNEQENSAAC